jgi:hypothetical protein
MATMGRLDFGRLTDAWAGEASDFTPLLADQLDADGSGERRTRCPRLLTLISWNGRT